MVGFFAVTLMNTNLGMALVCMVNSTTHMEDRGETDFANSSAAQGGCALKQSIVQEYEVSFGAAKNFTDDSVQMLQ